MNTHTLGGWVVGVWGVLLLSMAAGTPDAAERPEWIRQPKTSDSLYVYVIGTVVSHPTEAAAREAAFTNALGKIASQIIQWDGRPVAVSRLTRAELVPGAVHVESNSRGFDAWVQVSFPIAEKEKLLSAPRRPPSASDAPSPVVGSASSDSAAVSPPVTLTATDVPTPVMASVAQTIGPSGGNVEYPALGVRLAIPPGALAQPTRISITPYPGDPPPFFDRPLPPEVLRAIRVGPAMNLEPHGTRFEKPIEVEVRMSPEAVDGMRNAPSWVEVGCFDGRLWQPLEVRSLSPDGRLTFNTDHFSIVVVVRVAGAVMAAGALVMLNNAAELCLHPEAWVTPASPKIKQYIAEGHVTLPTEDRLKQVMAGPAPSVSLGLGRFYKPYSYWFIPQFIFGNGETMLTQEAACCQEATFFAASILRASGDPRFQKFICVQGSAYDKASHTNVGHMWMEIEVDGQLYVIDTAAVSDICLLPLTNGYAKYQLKPGMEFTDKPNSRTRYKGLTPSASTTNAPGRVESDRRTFLYHLVNDSDFETVYFHADDGPGRRVDRASASAQTADLFPGRRRIEFRTDRTGDNLQIPGRVLASTSITVSNSGSITFKGDDRIALSQ
ncbi:MAG: hypothetical protein HY343_02075 [Lentisphaerae bacterium]|nr:hypothetical protein [Lentisphaerota bacterium]